MKIKLNQLRRIIREEVASNANVVASNANVPQKLYHAEVSVRASDQAMDLAGYLEMLADMAVPNNVTMHLDDLKTRDAITFTGSRENMIAFGKAWAYSDGGPSFNKENFESELYPA
jgi:hypothetical protein|tara:strand:+ start:61 stop:408 length:348 start_codon:yes stop_codon:yes gene_type:complete